MALPEKGDFNWDVPLNDYITMVEGKADQANSDHNTHVTATDPHGVLPTAAATADAKIATHAAATDPHGDRAWADGKFVTITAFGQQAVLLAGDNTATVTDPAKRFARIDLNYEATGSTPDSFAFYYNGVRTGYHNEYGELRARPAKQSTVPFRAQAHALGSNGDIGQFTSSDNASVYLGVSASRVAAGVPIRLADGSTDPAADAAGGLLYVKDGALMYRSPAGTITTVAPA